MADTVTNPERIVTLGDMHVLATEIKKDFVKSDALGTIPEEEIKGLLT